MTLKRTAVLIAGAGPAGLSAALELKRLGLSDVIVVDREAEAGGIPRLCHHTGFGLRDWHRVYSGPQYARRYTRQAAVDGLEICTSTTITGWNGPATVTYTSPHGLGLIEARAILLATGCRERPRSARLVPGNRPQGIFTSASLQRFVNEHNLPVGKRAVIVGAEPVSLSALMTLAQAGVSGAMMITELPQHQIYFPAVLIKWFMADIITRTPIRTSTRVSRILGRKHVEGVEITQLDTGQLETVACDTVVFSGDWIPEHELARSGGLTIDYGTQGPKTDAYFRTSKRGVFAAGNLLRGVETADMSALEGRYAARRIHDFLKRDTWPAPMFPVQVEAPITWVFPNGVSASNERPSTNYFAFRVSEFRPEAQVQVQVCQGHNVLHTQLFHRLRPNQSMRLASDWLTDVNLDGEALRIVLAH